MRHSMFATIIALVFLFGTWGAVQAAGPTEIPGGLINENTTWTAADSPYIVQGTVTLLNGFTLAVEAGTVVQFVNGAHSLNVQAGATLNVAGTADNPVRFTSNEATPAPGDWRGILIGSGASANLQHCDIAHTGESNWAALYIDSSTTNVQHCRIHHSSLHGVELRGNGLAPTLHHLEIDNNGGHAIHQGTVDMTPDVANLNFHDNGVNGIVAAAGGVLAHSYTLHPYGTAGNEHLPFIFQGTFSVVNGVTLTVEAGTVVQFAKGGHSLAVNGGGTLNVLGTADNPVRFTSNEATPAPGDWRGIWILGSGGAGTANLQHCDIAHSGESNWAALSIDSSATNVQHCRIHHSLHHGVELRGTGLTPTLHHLEIDNNGGHAIQQNTVDMTPDVANLNLHDNGVNAIVAAAGGHLAHSYTLHPYGTAGNEDLPFIFQGTFVVLDGVTLTVDAGTVVQFAKGGHSLAVNGGGTLNVLGIADNPVRFTSSEATPAPGDWRGILIRSGANARLRHCVVEYAEQGVTLQTRQLIDSCIFRNNTTGVTVANNAGGTIFNSQFIGNNTAVANATPASPVRAFGNWWNHPSGPQHAANPAGQGDPVSDGVLYQGWLQSSGPDRLARVATPLTLGETVQRTIDPSKIDDFVYDAAGGENLILELRPANGDAAGFVLLGRFGALPWAAWAESDVAAFDPIEGIYLVSLLDVEAGQHFFTVLPELAVGSADYAITLLNTNNRIAVVAPRVHGPTEVTMTAHGIFNLDEVNVRLCNEENATVRTGRMIALGGATGSIGIDLSGVAPGTYNLCVTWPDSSEQFVANAVEVQPGNPQLEVRLERPVALRAARRATVFIHYASTGNVPVPAPAFVVDAVNATISIWPDGEKSSQARLYGFNDQPPFGLLPPGAERRVPIYLEVTSDEDVDLTLSIVNENSEEPFDWSAIEVSLRPDPVPADWGARWAATIAPFGTTWGSVIQQINNNATGLSDLSGPASPDTLLALWLYNALDGETPAPSSTDTAALAATAPQASNAALTLKCGTSAAENLYTYLYDPVADVDLGSFDAADFDVAKPTFILIHGLHESSSAMSGIANSLKERGNVIVVDWEVGAKISTGLVFSITQCRSTTGYNGPRLAGLVAGDLLRSELSGFAKQLDLDTTTVIMRDAGAEVALTMLRRWGGRAGATWLNPPSSGNGSLIREARSFFDPDRSMALVAPSSPTDALVSEVRQMGWDAVCVAKYPEIRPKSTKEMKEERNQTLVVYESSLDMASLDMASLDMAVISRQTLTPETVDCSETQPLRPEIDEVEPKDPDQKEIVQEKVRVVTSWDPNEKEAWTQYAMPGDVVRWTIYFENLAAATAPAQEVFINDQLPAELDGSSVRLLEVGFATYVIPFNAPSTLAAIQESIIIPDYRPEVTDKLEVRVDATVMAETGMLNWVFTTLDPQSGYYPEDPLAGFLPPNDSSGRGDGYVIFEVRIKPDVALGTQIDNEADIIFDTNAAINTGIERVIVGPEPTSLNLYVPKVAR